MARIRSIKPEFWKSESIAALTMQTRLTFIALWSYVDDNGVGRDLVKLITAEIYPLEDNPRVTLAHVSRSLDELSAHGRIVRYEVSGKPYLWITNWEEHQRVDRPGNPRYPLPPEPLTCTNTDSRDTLATLSRDPRETPSTGEGVKGSRGEGVKGRRGEVARARDGTRIPEPFIITDDMTSWALAEGIPPARSKASTERFIDYWRAKPGKDGRKTDWTATWRNWLRRDRDTTTGTRPSTSDQRLAAGMALAAKYADTERREIAQ